MQIRFSNSFEPDGMLCCIEPDEREGLAAVQLLEVFQLHSTRANYRGYPILEMAEPAESAKRFWIFSSHPIRKSQVAGFEKSLFVVFQKVRDRVMNWEPVHPFW